MTKVSIIVPVLNGDKFLEECIDSLVSQSLKEIEIIVVDGGSTDKTLDIIKKYIDSDNRIRLIHSEKKSTGYQGNLGMSATTGDYIGFCEADDYVSPTMYERLYECAKKEDLEYVKADFDMFIDLDRRLFLKYRILDGAKSKLYDQIICPSEYNDILFRDVNMWNGIYKKSFLESKNIRQNETPGAAFQDTGFVQQVFLASNKAMYIHADSYYYRRDNASSSVYDMKGVVNVAQEAEFLWEYLRRENISADLSATVFKRFCSIFFGFYGRLPHKSDWTEGISEAVKRFQRLSVEWYTSLPYQNIAYEQLNQSQSLYLVLKNRMDDLDVLRRNIVTIEDSNRKDFFNLVSTREKTVIYGAGECGSSVLAMLLKNGYGGVVAICDQDKNKQGNLVMDVLVISVEKAVKDIYKPGVLFVISVNSERNKISKALRNNGICVDDICISESIIPHVAMEIDLK